MCASSAAPSAGWRLITRELGRAQRPGLAQDRVRHLQLADVVQQRGDGETAQARAAQAELLADLHGELRDAPGVLARRGVLDGEARQQARHPGAEQRLLLGDDVVDVDLRVQRARRRGAREVAHERRHDDDERAQLEHVPGPEADRPDRAQQVGRDGDGEPHEACRDGQVADAARELERAQRAQREHAVDQRVEPDDPPDQRAAARRGRPGRPRGRAGRAPPNASDRRDDADLQQHEVADVAELARPREQRGQDHGSAERHGERARDADRGGVLGLDQEAGRRQAVHREQRGDDREARADGGRAAVVPAHADDAEHHGQGGAHERRRRDGVEMHVRDGEGVAVVRQRAERHDRRQPDGDGSAGRGGEACDGSCARISAPAGCALEPRGRCGTRVHSREAYYDEGSLADGGRHGVHLGVRDRRPPRQDRRSDLRRGARRRALGGSGRTGGVRDPGDDGSRAGRRGDLHDGDARHAADRARRRARDRLHELGVRLRRRHLRRQRGARQAVARHRAGRRRGARDARRPAATRSTASARATRG